MEEGREGRLVDCWREEWDGKDLLTSLCRKGHGERRGSSFACESSTGPSTGVCEQQEPGKLTKSQTQNSLEVVFRVRNGGQRVQGWGSPG